MRCEICDKKSEEIRDILRPYDLHLYPPVDGVRLLAESYSRLLQDMALTPGMKLTRFVKKALRRMKEDR